MVTLINLHGESTERDADLDGRLSMISGCGRRLPDGFGERGQYSVANAPVISASDMPHSRHPLDAA